VERLYRAALFYLLNIFFSIRQLVQSRRLKTQLIQYLYHRSYMVELPVTAYKPGCHIWNPLQGKSLLRKSTENSIAGIKARRRTHGKASQWCHGLRISLCPKRPTNRHDRWLKYLVEGG
jgi:hypothetical protein